MEVKSLLLKIPYPGKEVVYGMLVATSTQLLIAVSPWHGILAAVPESTWDATQVGWQSDISSLAEF